MLTFWNKYLSIAQISSVLGCIRLQKYSLSSSFLFKVHSKLIYGTCDFYPCKYSYSTHFFFLCSIYMIWKLAHALSKQNSLVSRENLSLNPEIKTPEWRKACIGWLAASVCKPFMNIIKSLYCSLLFHHYPN